MKPSVRHRSHWITWTAVAIVAAVLSPALEAQQIHQFRGVDARVDYTKLLEIGPWDDRNYQLTQEDLELLADNERELRAQIPAFFRVEMRKKIPEMRTTGPVQYPRSALQAFRLTYGGYLVEGKIYNKAEHREGKYLVLMEDGVDKDEYFEKFLNGEVRVTAPNGGAESAIKVNPVNTDLVIAGANGPGTGQSMHYSTDGGETWNSAANLPGGGTCCDPTVDWSSDGSLAYTATLGNCGGAGCQIWFYRSSNGGQTWNDLSGSPARRTLSAGNANDKEYIHVDKHASSPFKDNIYATWHSNNTLVFSRSTDFGNTWSRQNFSSASDQLGIGSDITTDKNGHVYYFWPAFNSQRILLRKSTNGGASFGSVIEVDSTEGSFAFPVPSMETREVFIYVSADADLSNGPFGGSIYAAWTDSTASTGGNANNNHARIQVAYSRNGGSTWTVTTPHETADSNSVDRWHQWLAVGPDGKVHVVFYDTRIGNRTTVDLFYSFSEDGAQTWSAPTRVTTQQSPNIGDSFEFGDYNGLDVVMQDLIAIFTDNRSEGGGGGDSVDIYAAGIPISGGGNTAPQVTISAPANGSSFPQGTSVGFAGTASDDEDGNLTSSLAWTSSLDGAIGSGGSFSATLSAGTHTVTASVTDSGGLQGSDQISVTITVVGNSPPSVSISAPANGSSFPEGTSVAFAGTASDPEDGNLTSSLAWASNRDGAIGNGGSFSATLSVGTHTITAAVTDSGGLQGSDQITVTITGEGGCEGNVFSEDFESGDGGWFTNGLWHLVTNSSCANPGYSSPMRAMYYGQDASCDYDTGASNVGRLVSPVIEGVTADSMLRFDYFRQVEDYLDDSVDRTLVAVRAIGGSWATVWSKDSRDASENAWTPSGDISLASWAGQDIQIRFTFTTRDEIANDFVGWLVDDVEVTGEADCPSGATIEVGQAEINHVWTPVSFGQTFTDPVVVAKPASINGSHPGIVRLRNVTASGFEVRFEEWPYLDGNHTRETIFWVAAERGRHSLTGGGEIEAGTLDTDRTRPGNGYDSITFGQPFATVPLVFSVVATVNDPEAVGTRQRNISTTGLQIVMQEQQSGGGHLTETLNWIAWTPGGGNAAGLPFEAGTLGGVRNSWSTLSFQSSFSAPPCFIADMQTVAGGDPANLRYRNLGATSVQIQVDEEQSADSETGHVPETVGYLAFGCE